METRTVKWIAESCGARLSGATAETLVSGVSTDSREIKPGDLFVAIPGERFDGHNFIGEVFSQGAVAAIAEEKRAGALPPGLPLLLVPDSRAALGKIGARYRREFAFCALAIAGSNGKTTTKELVAAVLRQKLKTVWSAASFNNDIGVPLTLLEINQGDQAGVFEAGTNHPGELRPLLEMIHPQAGIITSIGREHLEFFGDLDGVLKEEGTLAEVLPSTGFLVMQAAEYGAKSLVERTAARAIRVGSEESAGWRISNVRMDPSGTRFHLETSEYEYSGEYATRLLGEHQAVNAAYAIVVGKELGLGRAEIERGLASCSGAKMRMELRRIDEFTVLDDTYNANADSMHAALDTLQRFPCTGRRIAVLGDMAELGSSSGAAHEEVGRRAANGTVDCLITVGKSGGIIAAAAREAGLPEVLHAAEVEQAGPLVTEIVRPGDVVLVKASRATRLERLVEYLTVRFAAKEPTLART